MERDHLGDKGIDRKIILKRIFKKKHGEVWTGICAAQYREG